MFASKSHGLTRLHAREEPVRGHYGFSEMRSLGYPEGGVDLSLAKLPLPIKKFLRALESRDYPALCETLARDAAVIEQERDVPSEAIRAWSKNRSRMQTSPAIRSSQPKPAQPRP